MELFVLFFWCSVLGLITGLIARSKGLSFWGWWFYGGFIFIVALPHVLFTRSVLRKCPHCAESVKFEAVVCRHCALTLPLPQPAKFEANHNDDGEATKRKSLVPAVLIFGALVMAILLFVYRTGAYR
ncbi:MAG TPA: hypothetical protein VIX19_11695 [Terriglobales bacterium]